MDETKISKVIDSIIKDTIHEFPSGAHELEQVPCPFENLLSFAD